LRQDDRRDLDRMTGFSGLTGGGGRLLGLKTYKLSSSATSN
jgi:hypothetical protein